MEREQKIVSNMRLVHAVVNKSFSWFINKYFTQYDDLAQIGMIGLIKSVDRFDSNYGVKFSTYAVPMIRGEIQRFIRDINPFVHFSREIHTTYFKVRREGFDFRLDSDLIMNKFGITYFQVKQLIDYHEFNVRRRSIHATLFVSDGDEITLEETIGITDNEPESSSVLSLLTKRDQSIVKMRLHGYKQREIGQYFGVSQVQISRILMNIRNIVHTYNQEK